VRHGLNKDLGFTHRTGRELRRVAEVAKLMVDAGLIVLVSFISRSAERAGARALVAEASSSRCLSTPRWRCRAARRQGLYQKARRGELKNFTASTRPMRRPSSLKSASTRCSSQLSSGRGDVAWLSSHHRLRRPDR